MFDLMPNDKRCRPDVNSTAVSPCLRERRCCESVTCGVQLLGTAGICANQAGRYNQMAGGSKCEHGSQVQPVSPEPRRKAPLPNVAFVVAYWPRWRHVSAVAQRHSRRGRRSEGSKANAVQVAVAKTTLGISISELRRRGACREMPMVRAAIALDALRQKCKKAVAKRSSQREAHSYPDCYEMTAGKTARRGRESPKASR